MFYTGMHVFYGRKPLAFHIGTPDFRLKWVVFKAINGLQSVNCYTKSNNLCA